jgi:hypothetical protein
MSASGIFAAPAFIFSRLGMTPQLSRGGIPVRIYMYSKLWWMNEDFFSSA